MKFIKTIDGGYANANLVNYFFVSAEDVNEYAVCARSNNRDFTLATFTDRAETQAYLDKLVAKLNNGAQPKTLKEKITAARALIYSAYGNGYTDELDDALYAIDKILGYIYDYEHEDEEDEGE